MRHVIQRKILPGFLALLLCSWHMPVHGLRTIAVSQSGSGLDNLTSALDDVQAVPALQPLIDVVQSGAWLSSVGQEENEDRQAIGQRLEQVTTQTQDDGRTISLGALAFASGAERSEAKIVLPARFARTKARDVTIRVLTTTTPVYDVDRAGNQVSNPVPGGKKVPGGVVEVTFRAARNETIYYAFTGRAPGFRQINRKLEFADNATFVMPEVTVATNPKVGTDGTVTQSKATLKLKSSQVDAGGFWRRAQITSAKSVGWGGNPVSEWEDGSAAVTVGGYTYQLDATYEEIAADTLYVVAGVQSKSLLRAYNQRTGAQIYPSAGAEEIVEVFIEGSFTGGSPAKSASAFREGNSETVLGPGLWTNASVRAAEQIGIRGLRLTRYNGRAVLNFGGTRLETNRSGTSLEDLNPVFVVVEPHATGSDPGEVKAIYNRQREKVYPVADDGVDVLLSADVRGGGPAADAEVYRYAQSPKSLGFDLWRKAVVKSADSIFLRGVPVQNFAGQAGVLLSNRPILFGLRHEDVVAKGDKVGIKLIPDPDGQNPPTVEGVYNGWRESIAMGNTLIHPDPVIESGRITTQSPNAFLRTDGDIGRGQFWSMSAVTEATTLGWSGVPVTDADGTAEFEVAGNIYAANGQTYSALRQELLTVQINAETGRVTNVFRVSNGKRVNFRFLREAGQEESSESAQQPALAVGLEQSPPVYTTTPTPSPVRGNPALPSTAGSELTQASVVVPDAYSGTSVEIPPTGLLVDGFSLPNGGIVPDALIDAGLVEPGATRLLVPSAVMDGSQHVYIQAGLLDSNLVTTLQAQGVAVTEFLLSDIPEPDTTASNIFIAAVPHDSANEARMASYGPLVNLFGSSPELRPTSVSGLATLIQAAWERGTLRVNAIFSDDVSGIIAIDLYA